MALNFGEKRKLQAIVKTKLAALKAGSLSFAEKRNAQKELKDAFSKLKVNIDLNPDAAQQNQMLADLIAGKFNDEQPDVFLKILYRISKEIESIEPVKPPTIKYIEIHKARQSAEMQPAAA